MKTQNKPNFFKRLLNDKTKMSFIIIAISIFIVGVVLTILFATGNMNITKFLGWEDKNMINTIIGIISGSFTTTYAFLTALFALLRNGTKTREKKTLEALEAIKTLHTKLTIINKQVKKLKKGKGNG